MIRLRRTLPVDRLDMPRILAGLPALLQHFRDLKFGAEGHAETPDGRTLEGLQVTDGTHPRPRTSYSVVTRVETTARLEDGRQVEPAQYAPEWQRITITADGRQTTFTAYAAELIADDSRVFQFRAQEHGGPIEVLVTVPDPRRPSRLELALRGFIGGHWSIRGAITGGATLTLNQFPQLTGTFRHRSLKGTVQVTIAADTDSTWLATLEIQASLRGLFRLAAPLAKLIQFPIQKELNGVGPEDLTHLTDLINQLGSNPADFATTLLGYVAEQVPNG